MMPVPTPTNHAPVTVAVFASSVAAVALQFAKQKLHVDFAGMEPHLQTIVIGLAYFISNGKAAQ